MTLYPAPVNSTDVLPHNSVASASLSLALSLTLPPLICFVAFLFLTFLSLLIRYLVSHRTESDTDSSHPESTSPNFHLVPLSVATEETLPCFPTIYSNRDIMLWPVGDPDIEFGENRPTAFFSEITEDEERESPEEALELHVPCFAGCLNLVQPKGIVVHEMEEEFVRVEVPVSPAGENREEEEGEEPPPVEEKIVNRQSRQLEVVVGVFEESLSEVLERKELKWVDKVRILKDVANALTYLAPRGVVVDRLVTQTVRCEQSPRTDWMSGMVDVLWRIGVSKENQMKFAYWSMSPEQAQKYIQPSKSRPVHSSREVEVTVMSDIFAFGLLMWCVLMDISDPSAAFEEGIGGGRTGASRSQYRLKEGFENLELEDDVIQHIGNVATDPKYRPMIPKGIPKDAAWFLVLMKRCWAFLPRRRPTAEQIKEEFTKQIKKFNLASFVTSVGGEMRQFYGSIREPPPQDHDDVVIEIGGDDDEPDFGPDASSTETEDEDLPDIYPDDEENPVSMSLTRLDPEEETLDEIPVDDPAMSVMDRVGASDGDRSGVEDVAVLPEREPPSPPPKKPPVLTVTTEGPTRGKSDIPSPDLALLSREPGESTSAYANRAKRHIRGMPSFDFINMSNADDLKSILGAGSVREPGTESPVPRHRPAPVVAAASSEPTAEEDWDDDSAKPARERVSAIRNTPKRRPLSARFGDIFRRSPSAEDQAQDSPPPPIRRSSRPRPKSTLFDRKRLFKQLRLGKKKRPESTPSGQRMILLDRDSDMYVFSNRSLQVAPLDEVEILERISPPENEEEEDDPLVAVYKGEWNRRLVAVKFFDPVRASTDASGVVPAPHVWSFFHQNVARIVGVTKKNQKVGIMTEWMSNLDLKSYIMAHPNELRFADKVKCLMGVLQACEYLHERDFIIGELQTSSILLGPVLTNSKLSLSSIARIMKRNDDGEATDDSQRFYEVGTASHYRAPEVVLAKAITPSVDLFSFGIVMFEVFFENFKPFGQTTENIEIHMALNPNLRPKFDMETVAMHEVWFVTTMGMCWDSDPAQRPSFAEVLEIFKVENKKLMMTSFAQKVEDERALMPEQGEEEEEEGEFTDASTEEDEM